AAEQRGDPDISMAETLRRLGAEGVSATKKMRSSLVMTLKGSAQMLIRSVEDQNGALAWRGVCNAGVKKSICLRMVPKSIRAVLQMQSERSYDELVSTQIQCVQAATVCE
ncbi:unnamed protein product, partial [Prorocentrum cordatum]